jgi:hypothetical protein
VLTTEPEFKARPTTFEIVGNLRTTKAHGIALPATFHARADEMIE